MQRRQLRPIFFCYIKIRFIDQLICNSLRESFGCRSVIDVVTKCLSIKPRIAFRAHKNGIVIPFCNELMALLDVQHSAARSYQTLERSREPSFSPSNQRVPGACRNLDFLQRNTKPHIVCFHQHLGGSI